MSFIDWKFNQNDDTGVCYISENIISTPLQVDVGLENCYNFSWCFIYGSIAKPILSHKMSFTLEEVISKYSGSINEAKIHYGYVGWVAFLKKLKETTTYEIPAQDKKSNTINKG